MTACPTAAMWGQRRHELPDPRHEPFLRVPRVAAILGVSERSVYDLIAAGTIPAIRVGRRWRIPTAGLWRLAELGDGATITAAAPERT